MMNFGPKTHTYGQTGSNASVDRAVTSEESLFISFPKLNEVIFDQTENWTGLFYTGETHKGAMVDFGLRCHRARVPRWIPGIDVRIKVASRNATVSHE